MMLSCFGIDKLQGFIYAYCHVSHISQIPQKLLLFPVFKCWQNWNIKISYLAANKWICLMMTLVKTDRLSILITISSYYQI